MPPIPAADLRHLLVTILAGATDGDEARWDTRVGDITRLRFTQYVKTNWSIAPARGCRLADRTAIVRAVEMVRAEHPYCGW